MDRQVQQEINEIIKELKTHFQSEHNQNDVSLYEFSYDKNLILRDHRYLNQILGYANKGKNLLLPTVIDLSDTLIKLHKALTLDIDELLGLKSLILACEDIMDKFVKENDFPDLQNQALDIEDMPDLLRLLDLSFGPDGEVLDSASSKLASIRSEFRGLVSEESRLIQRISNKYKSSLEISQPVIKNGIQTLAVTASKKNQVPGMVVDRSKSGETLFVIPYELLEFENKKEKLLNDEKAEIARILDGFSKMFFQRVDAVDKNYYIYNLLDGYIGKVEFGLTYDGVVANIKEDTLSLEGLIHPLIPLDRAVDNDLKLGDLEPRVLIISGPNAGGKSVLMKAVALAAIMNQMGLMVACHKEATMKIFDEVDILTGDSESLSGNLSSFSGHLLGLKNMYENASGNSLVLVDEIGQGTAPSDGEAIGHAFIEHMLNQGTFGVFTTHYDGLKKYAISEEKILSGAMEFSEKTLTPTFKFIPGAVGNSYAFEVASKNGLPNELIESAKIYRDSQKQFDVEKLTAELNAKIKQTDVLQKKLDDKLNNVKQLEEKRQNAIKALADEKENIKKRADRKVDEYAQERLDQLDKLWSDGKKADIGFNEKSKIKGEIRKVTSSADQSDNEFHKHISKPEEVHPGDIVSYGSMIGRLVSANKNKAKFYYNGMTMTVNLSDLVKSSASKLPMSRTVSNLDNSIMNRAKGVSTKLNVIGMTVSEATPEVDKFLDNAELCHLSSVIIIHGMGTFALRNGIWAHLKKLNYVKSFREGGEGEGGLGATVVYLK